MTESGLVLLQNACVLGCLLVRLLFASLLACSFVVCFVCCLYHIRELTDDERVEVDGIHEVGE